MQFGHGEHIHHGLKAKGRGSPSGPASGVAAQTAALRCGMEDPDRRGEHRAAVFEQTGEVGGHRRSEREDQSEDHDQRRP